MNDVRFSAFSHSIKFTKTLLMIASTLQVIKITVSKHMYPKLHCLLYTTIQFMPLLESYMYTYHVNGKQQDIQVYKYNSQSHYLFAVQEILPAHQQSTTAHIHRSNTTASQEVICNLRFPDVS